MNLALDIGNSAIKAGTFEHGELKDSRVLQAEQWNTFLEASNPAHIIVGSVGHQIAIPGHFHYLTLTHETPLPIALDYTTVTTLGMDRVAAAVGARKLHQEGTSLVIDAGSCITYDLLEEGTVYRGGIISPGVRLRVEAMHTHTAQLPQIAIEGFQDIPFVGKSTEESMRSGVLYGLLNEMKGIIDTYRQKYPDIRVFLCGGEAKYFENRLKEGIFAVPELVLVGLNEILEYNLQHASN